ncbi:homeobox Hox-B5a-like [Solea senegalensis]|uniref:Homeobox Hox-B5a-like n=1 Tax=Solea senegalensis TaxID=28829 RepID=A0AAV6TBD5_SOLSE|nr:homeobox protein NANOG [Solea senegalensis]KAG7526518.1 homeobox Hox-B5a-like [Solea senegalensis]
MTDWKTQISYNYNPSYHAYAYGLVYQPGSEQNHGNHLSCWSEAGVTDLSNYNPGVTQAYYANTARAREESPPGSPEQHAVSGHHHHHHYPGSGVVYLGDTQTGRLLLSRPHRAAAYDSRDNEVERVRSDSPSDSEAHASPDSWSSSSSSSREGGLPRTDPATWAKKERDSDVINSRSPIATKDASSPLLEEPQNFAILGSRVANNVTSVPQSPVTAPNKPSTTAVSNPKIKVRAAFSESQMNTLIQRFSVQRYLTPAEMKNVGELTGLTYKQVKTWFQNRRMKLRRHQKDTSWVSERYTVKDGSAPGAVYANLPPHIPPYRGEAPAQFKEHYNQHMMEAAYKKTAPQNLAFYLAMNNAASSAGYASWPTASSQTAVHGRPQAAGWPMPPSTSHYEYNPNAFNASTVNNSGLDTSLTKEEEPVNS